MSREPLVSVIIPVLDAERVIGDSVASALGQTYRNIEVIVVDNGSTDGTCAAVSLLAQQDARVRLLDSGPTGVSHARNIGLENANGRYVTFCDADDLMESSAVADLLAFVESTDMVAGGIAFDSIDENRNVLSTSIRRVDDPVSAQGEGLRGVFEYLWERNCLQSCCSKLYSLEFIKNSNVCFDEALSSYEDLVFNLDLLSHGARFTAVPELCYRYLCVPTGTNWSKYRKDKTCQMEFVAERVSKFYKETLRDPETAACMQHIIQFLVIAVNNAQMTPGGWESIKRAIADVFVRGVFLAAAAQASRYPNVYSRLLVRLGVNRHYRAVALLSMIRNAIRDRYVAR